MGPFPSHWAALSSLHMRVYALLHIVIPSLVFITKRPAYSFLKENGGAVVLGKRVGGEKLGGGEVIVGMFCMI